MMKYLAMLAERRLLSLPKELQAEASTFSQRLCRLTTALFRARITRRKRSSFQSTWASLKSESRRMSNRMASVARSRSPDNAVQGSTSTVKLETPDRERRGVRYRRAVLSCFMLKSDVPCGGHKSEFLATHYPKLKASCMSSANCATSEEQDQYQ
jgi:hypothetical protein